MTFPTPTELIRIIEQLHELPNPFASYQRLPAYLPQINEYLTGAVLSMFGGADITPLANPTVSNLIILDAHPFLTDEVISKELSCPLEKSGLFHKEFLQDFNKLPLAYATMPSIEADHNSPYDILSSRIGSYGIANRPPYTEPVAQTLLKISFRAVRLPSSHYRSIYDAIGVSTVILYRLRMCLDATILSIEEIITDFIFRITIKRKDESVAVLHYVNYILGDGDKQPAVRSWLLENMPSINSLYFRGFPTPAVGATFLGELSKIKQDFKLTIKLSLGIKVLVIVCQTKEKKYNIPPFLNEAGSYARIPLPSMNKQLACELFALVGNSAL